MISTEYKKLGKISKQIKIVILSLRVVKSAWRLLITVMQYSDKYLSS